MLLATTLLWALNFTVTRYALTNGWNPLAYSALRYSAGALLFAAFVAGSERSFRVGRRRDVLLLGIAAGVGVFLNQVVYVYAIKLTNATTVALILGITPIFAALGAFAVGLERLSLRFWVAALVSFAGVALVALGAGEGGFHFDVVGDLLSVATAATWAAYSVVIAPLMRRYSPYLISAVVLLVGTAPLLVLASRQIADQDFGGLGGLAWAAIVFATIGPLVLTNVLWFRAVAAVGPSRATLFANAQPFVAAVIALILLSEPLGALQLAGGLAIAAGILLARRRPGPVAPTAE
jgi:drug/metabolite transporter (DMT)-like permease